MKNRLFTLAAPMLMAVLFASCSKKDAKAVGGGAPSSGGAAAVVEAPAATEAESAKRMSADELADLHNMLKIFEEVVQNDLGYKFIVKHKIVKNKETKEKEKLRILSLDVSKAKSFYLAIRKRDHNAEVFVRDHIKCVDDYISAAHAVLNADKELKDVKLLESKAIMGQELQKRLRMLEERISKDKKPSPFFKAPEEIKFK